MTYIVITLGGRNLPGNGMLAGVINTDAARTMNKNKMKKDCIRLIGKLVKHDPNLPFKIPFNDKAMRYLVEPPNKDLVFTKEITVHYTH